MLQTYNADENITVGITLLIEGVEFRYLSIGNVRDVLRNYTKFETDLAIFAKAVKIYLIHSTKLVRCSCAPNYQIMILRKTIFKVFWNRLI
jgi:hypothetical protein